MERKDDADVARYADILAALGTEPRLRILHLLLSAHPGGMVVGEIHSALGITGSTLSHHLEKLKNEELVQAQREGAFLRYSVNVETLFKLLVFLKTECCARSQAVTLRSTLAHVHKA
jgi:DNA-binding transcriptional ArsR family regulator